MFDKQTSMADFSEQLRAARLQERTELQSVLQLAQRALPEFRQDTQVDVGALVDVWSAGDEGDEARTLFVLPASAAPAVRRLMKAHPELAMVTPSSPVGKALLGRRVGEKVNVQLGGRSRIWTVLEVS